MRPRVIALDIGGTNVRAAVVRDGTIERRKEAATPRSTVSTDLVRIAVSLIEEWVPNSVAIGVAMTGVVVDGHVSSLNPATLSMPQGFPLGALISRETNLKSMIVNDAQAATWGEYRYGCGRETETFAFVTVSTGVGGGLVVGRKLLRGQRGLAGHFGHSAISSNTRRCGCGRKGCVEQIASGKAVVRAAREQLRLELTPKEVFARAADDQGCARILRNAALAIVEMCANLRATMDVDAICVGGGVGLNRVFRREVEGLAARLPGPFQFRLLAPKHEADAGLIGAADLALAS